MRRKRETLEPAMTEITIAPDGRVFVFGLSLSVLEICRTLNPHDVQLGRRLERLQGRQPVSPAAEPGGDR
ncbi:MAG: hypothetical protein HY000_26395 [Planctomycetes bacterium]|nr:hypothetical protein [Planctomycetota bacterium]